MTCNRCGRPIKHPVYFGGVALGSTCARSFSKGVPLRNLRAKPRDERQVELFQGEAIE